MSAIILVPDKIETSICLSEHHSLRIREIIANKMVSLIILYCKVLFWIYGGGFIIGGESYYDARIFASLHDVVIVVPNYRVSIFGFFSLGKDSDYPGNMGFHDQIMAMK